MPRKRPPFSALNNFHKSVTRNIRSGSSPFYNFLPLRRPSFPKCIYLQAVHRHPRPAYCSQPEGKAFCQRPGVTAGQSANQMRPTKSVPETRVFTLELPPEPRISTLHSLQSPPPPFSLCCGTYLPKFGGVPIPGCIPQPPPPPPRTPTLRPSKETNNN